MDDQSKRTTSHLSKFKWAFAALVIIGMLLMGFDLLRYGPRMGIYTYNFAFGLMFFFLPFGFAWLVIHFVELSRRKRSQQESDEPV